MTDATGTHAQHPALVTVTGPPVPPTSLVDATGTYSQHPALVTRPPFGALDASVTSTATPQRRHNRRRRHRHKRRHHLRRRHHRRRRKSPQRQA
jgi:hypothetical protein